MGQVIGAILAESAAIAERAAKLVSVRYEELPAVMTIEDAIAAGRWGAHAIAGCFLSLVLSLSRYSPPECRPPGVALLVDGTLHVNVTPVMPATCLFGLEALVRCSSRTFPCLVLRGHSCLRSFFPDRHAIVDGDPEEAFAGDGIVTVEGELTVSKQASPPCRLRAVP